MIRHEHRLSCHVESTTTVVESVSGSISAALKPFYGVCELESNLSDALALTQKLKKTLTSLKFLSGPYFSELETHIAKVNNIRAELKQFHHFISDQQQNMSRILHNPNEYGREVDIAANNEDGTGSCCPTDCCECCEMNEGEPTRRKSKKRKNVNPMKKKT